MNSDTPSQSGSGKLRSFFILLLVLINFTLFTINFFLSFNYTRAKGNPSPMFLKDEYWYCLDLSNTDDNECKPIFHPQPFISQNQPSPLKTTDDFTNYGCLGYQSVIKEDLETPQTGFSLEEVKLLSTQVYGVFDVTSGCDVTNDFIDINALTGSAGPYFKKNVNDPPPILPKISSSAMGCTAAYNYNLMYCQQNVLASSLPPDPSKPQPPPADLRTATCLSNQAFFCQVKTCDKSENFSNAKFDFEFDFGD